MSIYFGFIYSLLITELAIFSILILPLPSMLMNWKKHFIRLVNYFIQGNDVLKITSRCIIVFILIFFVDCLNKLKKLQNVIDAYSTVGVQGNTFQRPSVLQQKQQQQQFAHGLMNEYSNLPKSELYMNKFYSQRNLYLTGFTLFLSVAIIRISSITMDLLVLKNKISKQKSELGEEVNNELKMKTRILEIDEKLQNIKEKL